jgi:hypothetical protein
MALSLVKRPSRSTGTTKAVHKKAMLGDNIKTTSKDVATGMPSNIHGEDRLLEPTVSAAPLATLPPSPSIAVRQALRCRERTSAMMI